MLPSYLEGILLFPTSSNHTRAIVLEIISDVASSCQQQVFYDAF